MGIIARPSLCVNASTITNPRRPAEIKQTKRLALLAIISSAHAETRLINMAFI
jgi:hypothetical protein